MLRIKQLLYIMLLFFVLMGAGCNGKKENTPDNRIKNEPLSKQETNIQKGTPKEVKLLEKKAAPSAEKKAEEIKATFVELGSVNCIPCKMMKPVMDEIKKEYGNQVKVVFYDVWTEEGKPYAQQYRIRAIPTQVFLDKDGNEYYRHTGYFAKEELVKILKMQGVE